MKCQGACCTDNTKEFQEDVQLVRVFQHQKHTKGNWGFFLYCAEAIDTDLYRGLKLEVVNSNSCCWDSFKNSKTTCECDMDDFISSKNFQGSLPMNSIIQDPQGTEYTLVYHNLDGYGVVEGRHCFTKENVPDPEYMLSDVHAKLDCIPYFSIISKP